MKTIIIERIPHNEQRYLTSGDWWWEQDEKGELILQIRVSDMFSSESETAVAIHEIREAMLCHDHGIKEETVTNFDLRFESERSAGMHMEEDEPGDATVAPYHLEHKAAEFAERAFISAGDSSWEQHCSNVEQLWKKA